MAARSSLPRTSDTGAILKKRVQMFVNSGESVARFLVIYFSLLQKCTVVFRDNAVEGRMRPAGPRVSL